MPIVNEPDGNWGGNVPLILVYEDVHREKVL